MVQEKWWCCFVMNLNSFLLNSKSIYLPAHKNYQMKISYNKLKQYIDFDLTPEVLAQRLTDSGLEVESMEQYESLKGGLSGVVIGKVLTKDKHPNYIFCWFKESNMFVQRIDRYWSFR